MSEFFEKEAELSEDEENQVSSDSSDEEEDEDDDNAIDPELKDFITDDVEMAEGNAEGGADGEGEEDNDESINRKKKKKEKKRPLEEEDDEVDDDDLDLIEENLGVRLKKKNKLTRVIVDSDDEMAKEDIPEAKKAIERDLFDSEASEEGESGDEKKKKPKHREVERPLEHPGVPDDDEEEEESDDDNMNNFLVDDDMQPVSKPKKKGRGMQDEFLAEAQELFGADFDIADLNKVNTMGLYDDEDEDDEDYDEDEMDEDDADFVEDEEGNTMSAKLLKKKAEKSKKVITKNIVKFDPTDLEKAHYLPEDEKIKALDIPERFQLRKTPVEPFKNDEEANEEANWIWSQVFQNKDCFISNQYIRYPSFNGTQLEPLNLEGDDSRPGEFYTVMFDEKGRDSIQKIRDVLKLLRDQMHEVPFIHTYRREFCEPELNEMFDLWTIWQNDEKWVQLQKRKEQLTQLLMQMRNYLANLTRNSEDYSRIAEIRPLEEFDISQLRNAETMQQVEDVYQHFMLHYGHYIPPMIDAEKAEKARENGESVKPERQRKRPIKQQMYMICIKHKIYNFANLFGLTPENFGVNVCDQYQKHEPTTSSQYPSDIALELVCDNFPTKETVINAAIFMVAQQLAHEPSIRKSVRKSYEDKVGVNVRPTKKGLQEIDENHALYSMKYLKGKPLQSFRDADYLKLAEAENQKLIEIKFEIQENVKAMTAATMFGLEGYVEDLALLYYQDGYSEVVKAWNDLRRKAVRMALVEILFPILEKEVREKLTREAEEFVVRESVNYLHSLISVEPWNPRNCDKTDMDDEEDDYEPGCRVVSIAHGDDYDEVSFAVYLDKNGVCKDFVRLPNLTRHGRKKEDKELLNIAFASLSDFIQRVRPHVTVVCTGSYIAKTLGINVENLLISLEKEIQFPIVALELVNDDLASVYEKSAKAVKEFPDYPPMLRRAISAGRRLQDPLAEFCQMAEDNKDLLSFKFNALQGLVPQEDLIEALTTELVSMVNKVGVDVNRALDYPHHSYSLNYVCGLGPRKASALLQFLSRRNKKLVNRTQLVTELKMGPKLFVNCAGFIKIDVRSFDPENTDDETWLDPLDSTRIHPETYEWARKMAVDALEYDDVDADEQGQQRTARAVEEIMEAPDKLKDLDLDAFADELNRQQFGQKNTTLYDISLELSNPFKDRIRHLQAQLPPLVRFEMLTKETPESLFLGKMLEVTVVALVSRFPNDESHQKMGSLERSENGRWKCPFCNMDHFLEIQDVWNHFDSKKCDGKVIGVRVKLENGMLGFILTKYLSDNPVEHPFEKVSLGQTIKARIRELECSTFRCDLTCRTSDLVDELNEYAPKKDECYDKATEEREKLEVKAKAEKEQKKKQYLKRVIVHPNFENVTFEKCLERLKYQDQGDCLFRPSSKGPGHLTCTWKVEEDIYQHISIEEQQQENSFSLGKTLVINGQEFEDLDEVIATYIKPMALLVREISTYKYYFKPTNDRTIIERDLLQQKMANPSKIPYFLTACIKRPGCFYIVYLPRQSVIWEYISINPNGFKYRNKVFDNLNKLLGWFKVHFRDPRPDARPPQQLQSSIAAADYGLGLNQTSRVPGSSRPHADYGRQMTPRYNTQYDLGSNQRSSSISPPLGSQSHHSRPNYMSGAGGSNTPSHYGSHTPSRSHHNHQVPQSTYS